jgi:hypothetical protein
MRSLPEARIYHALLLCIKTITQIYKALNSGTIEKIGAGETAKNRKIALTERL